jgi:hypothetical protein
MSFVVSGITFIRYDQSRKIGKPNNFKKFESYVVIRNEDMGQQRLTSFVLINYVSEQQHVVRFDKLCL